MLRAGASLRKHCGIGILMWLFRHHGAQPADLLFRYRR